MHRCAPSGSRARAVTALALALAAQLFASPVRAQARGDETIGRVQQGVQGGVDDAVSTWVLGIVNEHYGTACTGSLIAPNLVLTTRHCLDFPPDAVVDCPTSRLFADTRPDELFIATCHDIRALGDSNGCDWHLGAEIYRPSDSLFCGNDIALVRLSSPVAPSQATPATPSFASGSPDGVASSESFSGIGFGATSATSTDWGTRRRVDGMAVSCRGAERDCSSDATGFVAPTEFVSVSGGLCEGDSGGPATFGAGTSHPVLLGVASRANLQASGCKAVVYAQLAPWASWMTDVARRAAAAGGYEPPAWAVLATPADPTPAPRPAPKGCAVANPRAAGADSALGISALALLAAISRRRRGDRAGRQMDSK